MTTGEKLYLILVLATFAGFAAELAYLSSGRPRARSAVLPRQSQPASE